MANDNGKTIQRLRPPTVIWSHAQNVRCQCVTMWWWRLLTVAGVECAEMYAASIVRAWYHSKDLQYRIWIIWGSYVRSSIRSAHARPVVDRRCWGILWWSTRAAHKIENASIAAIYRVFIAIQTSFMGFHSLSQVYGNEKGVFRTFHNFQAENPSQIKKILVFWPQFNCSNWIKSNTSNQFEIIIYLCNNVRIIGWAPANQI